MMSETWQVLVVEDEFDSAQMVWKILNFHGIHVHVAHNGSECLEMLNHIKPTLIVTDLAMPGMDGWEMLAAIRSNPETKHIPVVAVTAYDSVDVAREAKGAGFDAYFSKPVNPKSFVENLAKLIVS
jgi:CheY-like chemotaxis protein